LYGYIGCLWLTEGGLCVFLFFFRYLQHEKCSNV
jgi:hypothetical protein